MKNSHHEIETNAVKKATSKNNDLPLLIAIAGETASGKTAAAIEIAQKINGEIICADSRTIYRGMDIGTAKPTKHEQNGISHHLLDVVNIDEHFSAAQFKKCAQYLIDDIHKRGHVPIIAGGTGLYLDSLIFDFNFGELDRIKRKHLERLSPLELVDYATTNNISIEGIETNNKRHLVRAIERGGVKKQDLQLRRNTLLLGLRLDRENLKQRIDKRVEQMFADGFIDEVKRLADKYGWDNEAMSGIGYRVTRDYIDGRATLEEAKAAFKQRDRGLAKRQRTWFKRNPYIKWFDDPEDLIEEAVSFASREQL